MCSEPLTLDRSEGTPYARDVSTDDLITVNEAAAELGLASVTVRKRLEAGTMRGQNIGGRIWLIPRAEVERAKAAGPLKRGPKPRKSAPPPPDTALTSDNLRQTDE
ncbi:MAG: helix-turn-helix domain-containing protein [Dehalococcoidia bacterium]